MGRLLGYATQVAIARMFGPAQLGFYALGLTLVQLANILSMFGMDNSVVRYVARYRAEGDDARVRGTVLLVLGTTFALGVALSVAMFAGAGLLAEGVFGKPFLETTFRAFSLALPFFTLMSTALYATQGFQIVKYTAYVQEVLRPLISFGLVVVFYLLGAQILGAVAAYVLSMVAGSAFALYYLRPLLAAGGGTPGIKFEAGEVLGSSGPMMVAKMTNYGAAYGMIWILGVFVSAKEVGIYNAASRTAALSALVLIAFNAIFSPMISTLYSRSSLGHLSHLYEDVSRWIFTGSVAVSLPMAFFSRDVLAVFGGEFVSGWPVMVIIAAAQLFNSSVGLAGSVLAMTGHEKRVMWARIGAVATTIGVGTALVPSHGLLGAAAATAAGLVLVNAITLFSVKQLLNLWPYSWQHLKPLAAGLLAIGGALLARWALPLPGGIVAILVLGSVFLMLFAASILALRPSRSDREFLKVFWTAIRRRTVAAARRGA